MTELTPKQQLFVDEYLIDLNATKAAIRAGYSEKTAYSIGQENLNKPDIADAIEKAFAARSKRTKIDADWLLKRLAEEADADVADLFNDETGELLKPREWPKIFRQGLVAGIDVTQIKNGDQIIGNVSKIRLADRTAKMKLLGEHIGVQAFKQSNVEFEFPAQGTPIEKASAVFTAMSAGKIPIAVGTAFIDAIAKALNIEEITDLKARLERIEEILNKQ